MQPRSVLRLLAAFGCICGPASAKPEPDAATLKFIAACIRDYAWSDVNHSPPYSRQERQAFIAARRECHASRQYLQNLSSSAFRRHYEDALYLTTSRSVPRLCVAYTAAMRGVDVVENSARMNDALDSGHWAPSDWERTIVGKVFRAPFVGVDVAAIPSHLADVYRRHPNDQILWQIFHTPNPDGCLAECLDSVVAGLALTRTEAVLRVAYRSTDDFRFLLGRLSRDTSPNDRMTVRASLRGIAASRGKLAAAAKLCIEEMARGDADRAKQDRASRG